MKVTVVGAHGGIGQPLSLLLKTNPNISELSLYDIANVHGIATDLGHIDTGVKVQGHKNLNEALSGSNIVILLSGICRQPGMGRGDLFNINGKISYEICSEIINTCPDATILVVSNPINSMVPLLRKLLVKHDCFDCNKLIGVTLLDVVRSNTFWGELKNEDPGLIDIKVIGGHSGHSIVPLFGPEGTEELVKRVQYGGDEVVAAKEGQGSATLSTAFSINKLLNIILKGGTSCSYIYLEDRLDGVPKLKDELAKTLGIQKNEIPKYLAIPIVHGANGKFSGVKTDWIATLTDSEKHLLTIAFESINQNIEKGETFKYHNR